MRPRAVDPLEGPVLVPGELRGYRQFMLGPDGLYPLVHPATGPWDGPVHRARCATGADHAPPARECRCGLYAWYLPGSATVALGPASAVVAARGRCILGDRGFRAAEARVEAVALPLAVRWNPVSRRRTREMLTERYPHAAVYLSARRMLKDHPPHDVRALGIDPPADRSRAYRAGVAALLVLVLVVTAALAAAPGLAVAQGFSGWWPLFVVSAVAWQAGLIWLIARLLSLQSPHGPGASGPRKAA